MQRTSGQVISGWAAVLLMPIAIPLAFAASLWPGKKTVDRAPEEVAGFLQDFLDGTGGDWDWDEFTRVPISDPFLDVVRQKASTLDPRIDDVEATLSKLLEQVRAR
ncbi:hypothetical protein [Brevundimonas vesicularis]|uniref:hypothetical protein n=1 Tax=Brevundimonas vesicularis TaxID=41276 RepID=UPI0011BD96AE|nr:hypothetical protein [Brevundimonas vesicularis]